MRVESPGNDSRTVSADCIYMLSVVTQLTAYLRSPASDAGNTCACRSCCTFNQPSLRRGEALREAELGLPEIVIESTKPLTTVITSTLLR